MLTEQKIKELRAKYDIPEQGLGGSDTQKIGTEAIARRRLLASEYDKQKESQKSRFTETFEDIKQMGSSIKSRFTEGADKIAEIKEAKARGEQGNLASGFQAFGAGAGAISQSIGDVFTGIVKGALSPEQEVAVKSKVENVATSVLENPAVDFTVKQYVKAYKESSPEVQRNLEAGFNSVMLALDVFGAEGARQGIKKTIETGLDVMQKGKTAVKEGVETATDIGKKTATVVGEEVAEKAPTVAKFGVSQATGLSPKTIKQIIDKPESFTREAMKAVDRESFAKSAIDKIENRLNALKDKGKAYSAIRESGANVALTPNFIEDTLKSKFNFDIIDGKIKATTKSVTRNEGDLKDIQKLYDNWANKQSIDADEFLNLRSDLSELAKFDATKTSASQVVGKGLRKELNTKFRNQIEGLEKLDKSFKEEIDILKTIKKDYFKNDGTLKDNAISTLSNLTGRGKEQKLKRLKELIPNVEEQVNILQAVEDIKLAGGQKVGAYTRTAFGTGGLLTGNIPLIIGAIISTPDIAVQLIRQYGAFKNVTKEVVEGAVSSIKSGKKLIGAERQLFKDMINDKSKKVKEMFKKIKDDQAGFQKIPGLRNRKQGGTFQSLEDIKKIDADRARLEDKLPKK